MTHSSGIPPEPALLHARAASIRADPDMRRMHPLPLGVPLDGIETLEPIETYDDLMALMARQSWPLLGTSGRGSLPATNVVVKAYHANPAMGLVYPNDWQPMTTAQLAAPNVAPNNGAEVTVGPFAWVPSAVGHECMFMVVSAAGDPSNVANLSAGESIPEWRLVPNDNNVGQRNVFPVAGGGGAKGLLASLDGTKILVKNPHQTVARVTVDTVLPRFLAAAGWGVTYDNAGGGGFALQPGETKIIVLRLKAGQAFSSEDVLKAKDDVTIHVEAAADGIVVGGMSYTLDPQIVGPAKQ
jgi:hypothetical protein